VFPCEMFFACLDMRMIMNDPQMEIKTKLRVLGVDAYTPRIRIASQLLPVRRFLTLCFVA
jgi:hypothetical protein